MSEEQQRRFELEEIVRRAHSSGEIAEADLQESLRAVSLDTPQGISADLLEERINALHAPQEQQSAMHEEEEVVGSLRDLPIPQRIKLAMFGNSSVRAQLIRDPNKVIQRIVLKNPRLSVREIEEYSRNPNLSDLVLRAIGDSREWMRSYPIKVNIVNNPKTPIDIALRWLPHLRVPDLRRLARSRNLPQAVVAGARKRVAELE